MKTVLTTIAVIFFGTLAMAQNISEEVKVETVSFGITLDVKVEKTSTEKAEVVRLYRYKNSRIKKALSFRTKKNRAKLA